MTDHHASSPAAPIPTDDIRGDKLRSRTLKVNEVTADQLKEFDERLNALELLFDGLAKQDRAYGKLAERAIERSHEALNSASLVLREMEQRDRVLVVTAEYLLGAAVRIATHARKKLKKRP